MAELVKLNPRPGSSMGEAMGKNLHHIIPDFIVETEDDGNIILSLNNRNVPELRLNRTFTDMLEEQTKIKRTRQRNQKMPSCS